MFGKADATGLSEHLIDLVRENKSSEVPVFLSAYPDPLAASSAASAAVSGLYSSRRDLPNMILTAHLAIAWCLGQASLQADPEVAKNLKGRARAIAFNAAANCWPRWDDEGVMIDNGYVAAGLTLAGMCRALVQELALGANAEGTTHWLVGALELALGRLGAARAALRDAERSYAPLGADGPHTLMARAYQALAARLEEPDSADRGRELEVALQSLQALPDEEGQFFAEQVRTAERVFAARIADQLAQMPS